MNSSEGIPTGQPVPFPQTTILDLNDDCFLKILRYLEVEELAVASDTCRRFQDVAREAFKFEWKDRMISMYADSKESRTITTAILRNFGNQLQKIFVHFGEKWDDHLFSMIIEKCSSVQMTEVQLCHRFIGQDSVDRFRNKFTNLKSLGLASIDWGDDDFEEHFPTIEAITLFGIPFENETALKFIRLHPQLKRLSLEYSIRLSNARALLESIDQHVPHLEELELAWLPSDAFGTGYQPEFFKSLKRLSFWNFGKGYDLRFLSISNENVEELKFRFGRYDDDVADFICHYKKVKKLSIHAIDYPMDYKHLLKLNKHLPKLTEFEISSRCRNLNHQEIVKFVLDGKQLATLTIEDHQLENIVEMKKYVQSKLDIAEWHVDCDLSRKKLVIRNKGSKRRH